MPTTSNFGWTTPADTDLVKDGASAIRTLGNGIDSSMAQLKGGTTGQILSKTSGTDMAFTWINNDQGDITAVNVTSPITGGGTSGSVTIGIQDGTTAQKGAVQLENSTSSTSTTTAAVPSSVKSAYDLANAAIPKSTVTTNGDLIYGTGSATVTRLGIGSSGQVLTVSGGIPSWATPASSTPTFVGCLVTNNSDFNISNNTVTAITFSSEDFDTDGFHSTSSNTSRITIPSGKAGYYLVYGFAAFDTSTSGDRILYINKNGSANRYTQQKGIANGRTGVFVQGTLNLAVGDYVELAGYQDSGGTLNVGGGTLRLFFGANYLGA